VSHTATVLINLLSRCVRWLLRGLYCVCLSVKGVCVCLFEGVRRCPHAVTVLAAVINL
jgi:hypothetical protein